MKTNAERIEWNMTNHPPAGPEVICRFESLREYAKAFGHAIDRLVPPGREQSLALTELESSLMWAVAGVARNQEATPE